MLVTRDLMRSWVKSCDTHNLKASVKLALFDLRSTTRKYVYGFYVVPIVLVGNRVWCFDGATGVFRLSLLNKFYCDIFHLYNIVIPIINSVTSASLKKAGMACRNIVMKKQFTLF